MEGDGTVSLGARLLKIGRASSGVSCCTKLWCAEYSRYQ